MSLKSTKVQFNSVASAMRLPLLLISVLITLSACSGFKETLGLTRKAPDEFTVVTKAPLVVPPNFTLRPPRPGERAIGDVSARERARRAVIASARQGAVTQKARDILVGGGAKTDGSKGEVSLLSKAGAAKSDDKIREVLRNENLELDGNRNFFEKLLFWRKPIDKSVVVDAQGEARRLRTNTALGKAPNSGVVPTIKRKDRGILSLFD